MIKKCLHCGVEFEITSQDLAFYDKMAPIVAGKKMPSPVSRLCPACRDQRRLAIRNERNLYRRKSDMSGEAIISSISSDKPYKVFSKDEWWSDKWDAMEYGRDFDFSRPFFEQFNELFMQVPRMNLNIWQSENCDFCNYIDFSKDCYLVSGGSKCEDCYYSNLVEDCRDVIDSTGCKDCELGYDSLECVQCTDFVGCMRCENCSGVQFCFDCKNCFDCFGCYNLRHKRHYIFNKQYSPAEYAAKVKEITGEWVVAGVGSAGYAKMQEYFEKEILTKAVHRYAKIIQCEDCTGDNLTNSKNALDCFESSDLEDSRYVQFSSSCRDVYDVIGSSAKGGELCMEAMSIEGQRILAGYYIAGHTDIYYCDSVFACKDIFGCVGVKNKQYCILNKQYTKAEYEALVPRIIDHMVAHGEWGEFFPMSMSPFKYEETVAADWYGVV